MNNNDILRRIRFTYDFSDDSMNQIFSLGGLKVTRAVVCDLLKKDDDPDKMVCTDYQLAAFLNGLITKNRGEREGPKPEIEKKLTNNLIFKKLRIAFQLRDEDIIKTLMLAGFPISKHELSAFFRKPGHKHYKECQNQVLRYFLKGMQLKIRGK